jgi:hypothetical protein
MNEIVIAHYNYFQFEELLPLLSKYKVIIYNKGNSYYRTEPNIEVRNIPNIHREGYTYLTHIIDNYDNLAEWTTFIQDDTWNHLLDYNNFVNDIDNAITNNIKYYPHGCCYHDCRSILKRTIDDGCHPLHFISDGKIKRICETLSIKMPNSYETNLCAFITVHRDNILRRPKSFYIDLRNIITDISYEMAYEHMWILIFGDL